jgi:hypothetical protein
MWMVVAGLLLFVGALGLYLVVFFVFDVQLDPAVLCVPFAASLVLLFGVIAPREMHGSWWYVLSFVAERRRFKLHQTEGHYQYTDWHETEVCSRSLRYWYAVDGRTYERSLTCISDRWARRLKRHHTLRILYFPDQPETGMILTGQWF